MSSLAGTRLRAVRDVPAPPARLVAIGALAGLLAAGALLAVAAAAERRIWYVPASEHGGFPAWLSGPYHGLELVLTPPSGALLLVVMFCCYLVVLACARVGAVPARLAVGVVVLAHVLFLLAPPLFSADVFGYVDYARLAVVHGLDPYLHGASAAPHDAVIPYVRWLDVRTPYGPLFTLASMPLAWLSVPAALWACKAAAALLSLVCLALVWQIARCTGKSPERAILFVGLNPLLLAYGVGGAHNDFLLLALGLGGILLVQRERGAAGGALGALALGIKASAGLLLPFMLLAPQARPRRVLTGALAAGAALLVAAVAAFGGEALGFAGQIRQQQQFVAADSVPRRVAWLLGFEGLPLALRLVFALGFAAALAWLLWATWRRRIEWIAAAGWATLALLLSTAWLVPWYVVWLLPLAAVGSDRRLRVATLLYCVYLVALRVGYQLV
ncbi:MAG TPA: glycosyltransferase 87 family protein [Conexibacter sp.]|nr:glycosyltransferase 87 family protein [Conexibacter sp.]